MRRLTRHLQLGPVVGVAILVLLAGVACEPPRGPTVACGSTVHRASSIGLDTRISLNGPHVDGRVSGAAKLTNRSSSGLRILYFSSTLAATLLKPDMRIASQQLSDSTISGSKVLKPGESATMRITTDAYDCRGRRLQPGDYRFSTVLNVMRNGRSVGYIVGASQQVTLN